MEQINDNSRLATQLLLVMVFCFLAFTLLVSLLSPAINNHAGLTFSADALNAATGGQRQWLRLSLMINNLFSFTGTAVLTFWFVFRAKWPAAAGFTSHRSPGATFFSLLLFIAAIPLVIYVMWLNLQIPLPTWATKDEALTNLLIGTVLTCETTSELIFTLTVMAVVPALGEELLYRGLLQRRILGNFFQRPHLPIFLAAIVFSAAHFEFAGFLPRLVLGLALGYAYHWTKSIWVPILLHFLFNGSQVVMAYASGEYQPDTEMDFTPAWWVGALGLIVSTAVCWYGNKTFSEARPLVQGEDTRTA